MSGNVATSEQDYLKLQMSIQTLRINQAWKNETVYTIVNIILGMHFEAGLLLWILTAKEKIVKQSFYLSSLEAYLSKAEIFREKKEITLAILNYSQAIKCRPKDSDLYFKMG